LRTLKEFFFLSISVKVGNDRGIRFWTSAKMEELLQLLPRNLQLNMGIGTVSVGFGIEKDSFD